MDKAILLMAYQRPFETQKQLQLAISSSATSIFLHIDGEQNGSKSGQREMFSEFLGKYKDNRLRVWHETTNLGAAESFSRAISWVFETQSSVLIVEDDLDFSSSFFESGWRLLRDFEFNLNISSVSGYNPFSNGSQITADFFISKYSLTWGWGTWKNRWDFCKEIEMNGNVASLKTKIDQHMNMNRNVKAYWKNRCDEIAFNPRHIWDYQWNIINFLNEKQCIYPGASLISNQGFNKSGISKAIKRNLYQPSLDHDYINPNPTLTSTVINIDEKIEQKFYRINFLWTIRVWMRRRFSKAIMLRSKHLERFAHH